MVKVTTRYQDHGLAAFWRDVPPGLDTMLDQEGEALANNARTRVHVITGALRTSIGVISPLRDDYSGRAQRAAGRRHLTPFPTPSRPPGHTAVVAVGMPYGAYEEYGTRRRGPHPFFEPAVAQARTDFPGAVAREMGRMVRGA